MIELTNIALKNLQQSLRENHRELKADIHSIGSKANEVITQVQSNKTPIEEILQRQPSLEEHIQSLLESKLETFMVQENNQNKAEIFALLNKLNKAKDKNHYLRYRSMRSRLHSEGYQRKSKKILRKM